MAACAPFDPLAPFAPALTDLVDCHAQALGREGYLALANPGSPLGMALTGLLTLYVAVAGYRMMLGEGPTVRWMVMWAVRLGLVLALATQWPAYQVLAYDLVIQGPQTVAASLLNDAGLGDPSAARLSERVQNVYAALDKAARAQMAAATAAPPPSGPIYAPGAPGPPLAPQPAAAVANPGSSPADATRLAAISVLVTGLAGLLSVRLAAGLALGLGPLFVACLLFETTRGLFEGWVRALAGAALGAIAAAAMLMLHLAVLEPQVGVLAAAATSPAAGAQTGQILATNLLFAAVLLGALGSCVLIAARFRLPMMRPWAAAAERALRREMALAAPVQSFPSATPAPAADRAQAVVDAVGAQQRREQSAPRMPSIGRASVAPGTQGDAIAAMARPPLGQLHRRRAHGSSSAARRDARS